MKNNQIERENFIEAPLEKVWTLINQPAWWCGEEGPNQVQIDGSRVVAQTKYGDFPVMIEKTAPPNYIACRWSSTFPGDEPREGNSTLVEFTLTPVSGGTLVRVVESGFANLDVSEDVRNESFEGNTKGWIQQLDMLRRHAE